MALDVVEIDGSFGEGGGQILRTSASLAVALGKGVRVFNIRANRPQRGLRAQHVTALQAVAQLCAGQLTGAQVGSERIELLPGPVTPGVYHFDIGTAGSANLVLQTLLPPLLLAQGDSQITVTGGTHNPLAPSFEYLRDVFGPLMTAMGAQSFLSMTRAGFYPAGGGEVMLQLQGLSGPEPLIGLNLMERGDLKFIEGLSAATESLPSHIAERQAAQAMARLRQRGLRGAMEQTAWPTFSPGTVVFLRAVFGRSVAGFFALGQIGKPAERVADDAVDALLAYLDAPGALDPHAADQVLAIAALCPEPSRYTTTAVTQHLLTNAHVVRQLTGRSVTVEGDLGQTGCVAVAQT